MYTNRSWIAIVAGAALLAAGCAGNSATETAATTATTSDSYGPRHGDHADASSTDDSTTPGGGHGHRRSDHPNGRPDEYPDDGGDPAADLPVVSVDLTQDEIDGLLWMREEEQLAHDVYVALGDEWGLRIFDNIAASETTHVERVTELLDRYGIDDPMTDRPTGTFTIPEMQQWYDEIVADGRESLVRALEIGALIEETDIVDLRDRATDIADIDATYDLLERGSHNHLRAFTRQLDARGATYEPTVLDAEAYDEIVSAASTRG